MRSRADAVREAVTARLRSQGVVPLDALNEWSAEITREHTRNAEAPRAINKSLNEADTYYAIHDADLKLVDETAGIAAGLWKLTSNPIPVLGKLVGLLYRYRRKRVKLDGKEGLVLMALKEAPAAGWTPAHVREHLRHEIGMSLAHPEVLALLNSLKSLTSPDTNKPADLVVESKGRWRALDV